MGRRAKSWQFVMERDFWMDETLCAVEKTIIAVLAAHCDMKCQCWPTKPQLCRAVGIGARSLWDHLHALKAKGFISWREVRDQLGHRRNLFTLNPPCKIRMMGSSKATMQILHGKLRRYTPSETETNIIAFRPRKRAAVEEVNNA